VLFLRVRRGGSNANSALRRLRFILPPGLRFTAGAASDLGVNASRRLRRRVLRIGRKTLIVRRLPGGTSPRIVARFPKGTLKASNRLRRRAGSARPRFRLRVKVKGGRTFRISKRVRPRS
jgi:hypothetical protein